MKRTNTLGKLTNLFKATSSTNVAPATTTAMGSANTTSAAVNEESPYRELGEMAVKMNRESKKRYTICSMTEVMTVDDMDKIDRQKYLTSEEFAIFGRVNKEGEHIADVLITNIAIESVGHVEMLFLTAIKQFGKTYKMIAKCMKPGVGNSLGTHKMYPRDHIEVLNMKQIYDIKGVPESYFIVMEDKYKSEDANLDMTIYIGRPIPSFIEPDDTVDLL